MGSGMDRAGDGWVQGWMGPGMDAMPAPGAPSLHPVLQGLSSAEFTQVCVLFSHSSPLSQLFSCFPCHSSRPVSSFLLGVYFAAFKPHFKDRPFILFKGSLRSFQNIRSAKTLGYFVTEVQLWKVSAV